MSGGQTTLPISGTTGLAIDFNRLRGLRFGAQFPAEDLGFGIEALDDGWLQKVGIDPKPGERGLSLASKALDGRGRLEQQIDAMGKPHAIEDQPGAAAAGAFADLNTARRQAFLGAKDSLSGMRAVRDLLAQRAGLDPSQGRQLSVQELGRQAEDRAGLFGEANSNQHLLRTPQASNGAHGDLAEAAAGGAMATATTMAYGDADQDRLPYRLDQDSALNVPSVFNGNPFANLRRR